MKRDPKPKPKWIMSVKDLSRLTEPQPYRIDGENKVATKNRYRNVLETLMRGPVFCASPIRLSDAVLHLKRYFGVSIATETASDGRKYYRLESTVERISAWEAFLSALQLGKRPHA